MGTEKCPFCGQEIDAQAAKCFFCGAKLDAESVERRLEELHHLEALQSARKTRHLIGLSVIAGGVLLGVLLFRGVPRLKNLLPFLERPSDSLASVVLNPTVTFNEENFVVSNNDSFDWENVSLEILSGESGEPFRLAVAKIPARGTHTAGAAEFRRADGALFDASSAKPWRFRIRSDVQGRPGGSYLAEWR